MKNQTEKAKIWYLYNSGFAVQTGSHFLIFDYYPFALEDDGNRGLEAGEILAEEIKDFKVFVFVSHWHPDHFDKEIFAWKEQIPNIHYVLSDDVKKIPDGMQDENFLTVHHNRDYQFEDLSVSTLKSTDSGVAFLVKVDGLCIYHAGDLNWWNWEGEPEDTNTKMGRNYCGQIDLLKNEKIDLAFVPLDPRLEGHYLLGMDYFMRNTQTQMAVPMHFGQNYAVFDWLKKEEQAKDYRNKIVEITHRGQQLSLV